MPSDPNSHIFIGTPRITGPRWSHLPTLTIGLLGVQIFWSVEMGYASPYLLSLGLSKSSMAIVFVAGPLSGLLMQPLIGALADTSTSKWGRRRPFMVIGTLVSCAGMGMLGFTKQVAAVLGGGPRLTVALAVLSIYLIDFSINAIMAMDRALLVDTLPPARQADGNAWAARMLGVGAVVGFAVGTVDLTKIVPAASKGEGGGGEATQLQVLSVIVSVILILGHAIMVGFVSERVLVKQRHARRGSHSGSSGKGLKKWTRWRENVLVVRFTELWSNMVTLPKVIQQICIIQFFTWIAWFPILFYTSIYIGDIYKRNNPLSPPSSSSSPSTHPTPAERDAEATRLGSRALFWSSIISLFLNIALPVFIKTPASKKATTLPSSATSANGHGGHGGGGGVMSSETPPSWLRIPEGMKVNLATLWAVSQLVLAGCMLGTLFTDSVAGASLLIAATGFPWAITQWAPFSLLGEAILTSPDPSSSRNNARNSILLADVRTPVDGGGDRGLEVDRAHGEDDDRVGNGGGVDDDDANEDVEMKALLHGKKDGEEEAEDDDDVGDDDDGDGESRQKKVGGSNEIEGGGLRAGGHGSLGMGNVDARTSMAGLLRVDTDTDMDMEDGEWEDVGRRRGEEDEEMGGREQAEKSGGGLSAKAGIILGIHNVFIVIPQFLVTGLSAVVFAIFDPVKAPPSSVTAPAPQPPPQVPSNSTTGTVVMMKNETLALLARSAAVEATTAGGGGDGQSNSVVYIFRIGGVSALIAFIICWRLARELRHG